jgi:multidrug efflux pump subunit AcrA (membrane-fusion protein)
MWRHRRRESRVALRRPVTRYLEATGNTAAVNSADLVARVSGIIEEISYRDGALVKKGALPFTIEPPALPWCWCRPGRPVLAV